jgi:two-component system NtrC family response regulator
VRELENRVKRAIIMAEGRKLTAADLELSSTPAERHRSVTLKEAREELERDLIRRTLRKHNGNMTRTAAELQVSRPTLYELMEKLGIRKPDRATV